MQVNDNQFLGRVAVNGMGRIGRTLFRIMHERGVLKNLVAVNDIMPKENLIYLLKYDSIHGTFSGEIASTANGLSVEGHEIPYFQQSEPGVPWSQPIDIVVEATGLFTHSREASQHLATGAKRVLLTTFSKDLATTVISVNRDGGGRDRKIITPGDCTINCVAPIVHLMENHFGVNSVHINVIQGYTTRQQLIDGPYKGLRRGRAAGHSIVPFEVNIKPVLEEIFPSLKNRVESLSTRVPIPCGALADLSIVLRGPASNASVRSVFEVASHGELKNILAVTDDPIVSADILGDSHSGTVDGSLLRVTNGNHLKVLAWFDNEWGYGCRLFDWLAYLK